MKWSKLFANALFILALLLIAAYAVMIYLMIKTGVFTR